MGRKIFVSYKYADSNVRALPNNLFIVTKSRDYVNELQKVLDAHDEIYKGEDDGEDLSDFANSSIETRLRKRIFDSSITIVLVSEGMKDPFKLEKDQWIPWEISYSLREKSQGSKTSRPNALLMVVLPNSQGSYEYYMKDNTCNYCNCRTLSTHFLFDILRKNTFNNKNKTQADCNNHGSYPVYTGDHSYISSIKWDDFIKNPSAHLDNAIEKKDNIESFEITKLV